MDLFLELRDLAKKEIKKFKTVSVKQKADKTVVTQADLHLSKVLTKVLNANGYQVICEEYPESHSLVKSGNYAIIDPIDGTAGFIEHLKRKTEDPRFDFCLLVGIVINSVPRYGLCYNFVTDETIIVDSKNKNNIIEVSKRRFNAINARYFEDRSDDKINNILATDPSIDGHFNVYPLGLRTLLLQLNGHNNAVASHFAQQNGLYDIMPAAVAAQFTGAKLLDGFGNPLKYDEYVLIPGGIVTYIGNKYEKLIKDFFKIV